MRKPLHLLIVEDSEHDALLIARELRRGGYEPVCEQVENAAAFLAALAVGGWDAIIADYNLPSFGAVEALRLLQASKIDLPFLIVSGSIAEDQAVAAMNSGADDYILKGSLARLVPAMERELRDARGRQDRRQAEEAFSKLAAIVESSGDAIIGQTPDGTITSWNLGAERLFGYRTEEALGRSMVMLVPPDRFEEETKILERLARGGVLEHFETVRLCQDGRRVEVSVTVSSIKDKDGAVIGASSIARDITKRRRAETSVAALLKLGQSLALALTPLDAARVIGNIADELFGWDAFTLDLYALAEDQIQTVLNVDTIEGRKQDVPSTSLDGVPSAVARRIIDSGAELILRDPASGSLPGAGAFGDKERPSASLMFVPVRNHDRVIGIMSVQSYRTGVYDPLSLGTLQTLADYCGGALDRIRAREELRSSREQLRALAAHLQSVREEDRKLMAREIHDELGQSLTGFKMDLAWMRNRLQSEEWQATRESILEKIAAMGKLLDGTAGLVRRMCTELRPGVLDDLGLTAAIEWQAREYQNRTGIICAVRLGLEDLPVDPERATALFRIFQEILTNVARHARATRMDVLLDQIGTHLLLEVKDNGRGIKKSELSGAKSFGLLGMRERVFILGGEIEIRGLPGKGTTVRVRLPLPESKTNGAETVLGFEPAGEVMALLDRENRKAKRKVTP